MAEPVIQALAQLLVQALKKPAEYVLEFHHEFNDMKEQLDLIKSFLTDANKLKRKEEIVKTTLSMLRDLVYDAEDILTDCLLRAEYRKQGFRCNNFSLRELMFQYQTGKKLRDINDRIKKIHKIFKSYFKTIGQQTTNDDRGITGKRWTSPVYDESIIVGLTEDAKKILGWILPKNRMLNEVGIVGMGGLGKTTISQKIFNNKQVVDRFEKRIWVSISQTVNEEEIMKTILKQLGEDVNGLDMAQMLPKIKQALEHWNYLIVLDDVWSAEGWWDRIRAGLPKREGQSSGIIITTRIENVATEMGVQKAQIHQPRFLNEEESWALFCRIAFSSDEEAMQHYELEEVGKGIVKKCCGLPLAIKTIGGLLKSKTQSTEVWRRISNNFRDALATRESESSVMASLQLSYDELPVHLKQCLLCFSMYPEDSEIWAEQLVHWWVGEGFIEGRDTRTTVELAHDYLSELISRCLVEVVQHRGYDGRVYSCKMHDLVRDLTIKIAREEAFCSFDQQGRQRPSAQTRRLGFTGETDVKSLHKRSKLRALLMMTNSPIQFEKIDVLLTIKSLRVLDFSQNRLENICIDNLLNWISSLERLAYLNLRGVSALKELPHSIGKLHNLQLLVLSGCNNLRKLASSITTLQKLTILDIGYCPIQYLPQGIGKLSNLQELSGFKLEGADNNGCRLGELQNLLHLRVLRVNIGEESEIAEGELTVLFHLKQLKVLSINAEGCQNDETFKKLDRLSPPPHLEELYLRHFRGAITPKWINPTSLCHWQYLCLENGDLKSMSPIFDTSPGKAWKVEGLCLKFLTRLQVEWRMVQKAMPRIRYVEVSHCYMLESFPCNTDKLGVWRK